MASVIESWSSTGAAEVAGVQPGALLEGVWSKGAPTHAVRLDRAVVAIERAEQAISDVDAEIRNSPGPAHVRDRGVGGVD